MSASIRPFPYLPVLRTDIPVVAVAIDFFFLTFSLSTLVCKLLQGIGCSINVFVVALTMSGI